MFRQIACLFGYHMWVDNSGMRMWEIELECVVIYYEVRKCSICGELHHLDTGRI